MLRAGFTVFPISPRNNPPAIAHLLKKTSTTRLFVSQEPVIQSLASASIELFKKDGDGQSITVYETPIFEDLFLASGSEASFEWFPSQHFNMEAPALILHSSGTFFSAWQYFVSLSQMLSLQGSTAFPKPVTWDHRGLLVLAKVPCMCHVVSVWLRLGSSLSSSLGWDWFLRLCYGMSFLADVSWPRSTSDMHSGTYIFTCPQVVLI